VIRYAVYAVGAAFAGIIGYLLGAKGGYVGTAVAPIVGLAIGILFAMALADDGDKR